jgi:hypothetical protein
MGIGRRIGRVSMIDEQTAQSEALNYIANAIDRHTEAVDKQYPSDKERFARFIVAALPIVAARLGKNEKLEKIAFDALMLGRALFEDFNEELSADD